mgnify:CR=1 FL=1
MTKKIILTLILCFVIISCGKKGDPVYTDPDKKSSIQNTLLKKA